MYVLTQTKGKLKLDAQSPTKGAATGTETTASLSDPKSITRAAIAAVMIPYLTSLPPAPFSNFPQTLRLKTHARAGQCDG